MNNNHVFSAARKPVVAYKTGVKRELVVKIDVREGANSLLVQTLRKKMVAFGMNPDTKLLLERLDIFDVMFVFADDHDKGFGPCIERKTASDLAASLKDGRYSEQKGRMGSLGLPAGKAILLYEGNLLEKWYGIDTKSLIGASIKPVMRGENEVTLTQNVDATADIILEWLRYLEHMDEPKLVEHYSYVKSVQSDVRKRDFKTENMFALMIKDFVHGATGDVANAIVAKYPSLAVLIHALMTKKSHTMSTISNITYMVGGTMRKIGPARTTLLCKMCDVAALSTLLNYKDPGKTSSDDSDDELDEADDDNGDADYDPKGNRNSKGIQIVQKKVFKMSPAKQTGTMTITPARAAKFSTRTCERRRDARDVGTDDDHHHTTSNVYVPPVPIATQSNLAIFDTMPEFSLKDDDLLNALLTEENKIQSVRANN